MFLIGKIRYKYRLTHGIFLENEEQKKVAHMRHQIALQGITCICFSLAIFHLTVERVSSTPFVWPLFKNMLLKTLLPRFQMIFLSHLQIYPKEYLKLIQ